MSGKGDVWVHRENAEKDETIVVKTGTGRRVVIERKAAKSAAQGGSQVGTNKTETKGKKKNLKGLWSGLICFVAGMALIQPGAFTGVLIIAAISALVGAGFHVMSSGLDTTTHNAPDNQSVHYATHRDAPKGESPAASTGDAVADELISKGHEMLRQIRRENIAIKDPTLTEQMNELEERCEQIFSTVAANPDKAPQVRKFLNYYLPTTLKMLTNYRRMSVSGVSVSTLRDAHATTTRGMDMILTACRKLTDNLYKLDMLDVSTDIDVLEQMLKRDGFMEGEGTENAPVMSEAPTAAMQQMQQTGAPTLNVPNSGIDDDFMDYYHQKKKGRNAKK